MNKLVLKLLLVLAVLFFVIWKLSSSVKFQLFGELIYQVDTEQKLVALTFDDGPTPHYTAGVLQLLDLYQVKATFFVTGADTQRYMTQAKQIVAAGHQLGNHSWSHQRMVFMSLDEINRELEGTDQQIRTAGFEGEILFRPPYGKKLVLLPWYLANTHRTSITWDVAPETFDEDSEDPQTMATEVLEQVKPGSIVLLHLMYKNREASRAALPLIIKGLKEKGYRMVTLSELLAAQ
ncbi:polysaccharide deacetylase family protein [Rheinheimera sp. MM224]|uniref:polysaccharide deacetylase family protein n=1 Tax=Rheinheimera sp. MM224 TaxID=3019969 RepID=UPI0021F904E6|nr:polysaccharide deacetylase family protein [Rheinheimera sp. MM224]CAI3800049.1 Peptidoglycan-N-acetylglucosamine deacetylase [Rheinheimera sp. MM224]